MEFLDSQNILNKLSAWPHFWPLLWKSEVKTAMASLGMTLKLMSVKTLVPSAKLSIQKASSLT